MKQSRNYCLTINNPAFTVTEFLELAKKIGAIKCIAQLEKGESGTPHIQAFVGFKEARKFSAVKKRFGAPHLEAAKCAYQAWQYCQKEDTRIEPPQHYGEMPKPAKRKNITYKDYNTEVLNNLEGMVADGRVNIREYQKLKQSQILYKLHTTNHEDISKLVNEWHYGPTGTGKSSTVRKENPIFYHKIPNKWWDGYKDQEVVIIDDFGEEHSCLGYHLKIWADHYPFTAEVKGTTISLRPSKIIVTSNYHPSQIWAKQEQLQPILRRFKMIEYK